MTPEEVVEKYGHMLVNTGGNDPLALVHRLDTERNLMSTNVVVFVLATAVLSQIHLLQRMHEAGVLK